MNAPAPAGRLLTFYVGEEQFAASAAFVSEVFRRPPMTRVPNGPPSLLGITGLRGLPTPIVSLARLMGREGGAAEAASVLLLKGEPSVGLAVDRMGALIELPVSAGASEAGASEGGASAGGGQARLYRVEDQVARLLDLDALLNQAFAVRRRQAAPGTVADRAAQEGERESEGAGETGLLAVTVGGQAYALPLEEVVEAVRLPAQLTPVAQSDETVSGVVERRERLLAIVSARALLGLPPEPGAERHVVVVRLGEAAVGLAVDRLQTILRVSPSTIDAAPAVLNRGPGEAQVQAICRLGGNAGLVAILSAARLFSDEKVARIVKDTGGESEDMGAGPGAEQQGERFVLFRLGTEEYGLPLAAVDEIVRLPERLTRAPKAPAFIEGVANIRGKVIPIIDQARRFASADAAGGDGAGDDATHTRRRVIVTKVDGRPAGFIVDAVSEVVALAEDQIERTPELTADAGRLFSRLANLDGGARLILLVEPKELLDRVEQDLLAALDTSVAATT